MTLWLSGSLFKRPCLFIGVVTYVGLTLFKIPGALYTWDELTARVKEQPRRDAAVLFWARFVAFPVLALIILLSIQIKSRRGLQQALGEAHYDSTSAPLA